MPRRAADSCHAAVAAMPQLMTRRVRAPALQKRRRDATRHAVAADAHFSRALRALIHIDAVICCCWRAMRLFAATPLR